MNLKESKDKLAAALGDDMKTYLEYLKLWFRQKVTRDEFESRTRRLLKHQHLLRLHNEFILELLAECQNFAVSKPLVAWPQSLASSSASTSSFALPKRRKMVESTVPFQGGPAPASTLMCVDFDVPKGAAPSAPLKPSLFPSYCSNDLFLPDASLVAGRAKITAWLHGLADGVSDDACQLIVQSCENMLKRIVTGAVMSTGSAIYRRCGMAGPHAAPFGRPLFLKPNTIWSSKLFDAIYPELNVNNYASDNAKSLLYATNFREIVEAQEAHLLAFSNDPAGQTSDVLTLDRLNRTLNLDYLDLSLPNNFRARCLVRVNGNLIVNSSS